MGPSASGVDGDHRFSFRAAKHRGHILTQIPLQVHSLFGAKGDARLPLFHWDPQFPERLAQVAGDVLRKTFRGTWIPNNDISRDEWLQTSAELLAAGGIGEQDATAGQYCARGGRDFRSRVEKGCDSSPTDVSKEIGTSDTGHHSRKEEMDRQVAEPPAKSCRRRHCQDGIAQRPGTHDRQVALCGHLAKSKSGLYFRKFVSASNLGVSRGGVRGAIYPT